MSVGCVGEGSESLDVSGKAEQSCVRGGRREVELQNRLTPATVIPPPCHHVSLCTRHRFREDQALIALELKRGRN